MSMIESTSQFENHEDCSQGPSQSILSYTGGLRAANSSALASGSSPYRRQLRLLALPSGENVPAVGTKVPFPKQLFLPYTAFVRTKQNQVQSVRVLVAVEGISCKCVQKAVAGGLMPCSLLLAASTGGLGVGAKNPPCRSERVQAPGLGMHAPPGRGRVHGSLRFPPACCLGNIHTSEHLKGRKVVLFICLAKLCPSPHTSSGGPLLGSSAPRLFLRSRWE